MKVEELHMKKALITGITGQDGSYLAEFLLEKGYDFYECIYILENDTNEMLEYLKAKKANYPD